MLAIRMQRTGRRGHAQFRVIVQDSRFSPSGGRVVAYLGSYDPHTKKLTVDSEKASQYLSNGAQPSDKVARLLKQEGVKLPSWVKLGEPRKRVIRNPEKLRRNRPESEAPAAEEAEVSAEAPAAEAAPETAEATGQGEETATAEAASDEAPAEPAQETKES